MALQANDTREDLFAPSKIEYPTYALNYAIHWWFPAHTTKMRQLLYLRNFSYGA
jgi:hypothetical protein